MNNVIATGSNSKYFRSLKTLIFSVLKYTDEDVSEIHVYDLGLNQVEIKELKALNKVTIYKLPNDLITTYPHFKDPKNFAWKTYVIFNEVQLKNTFIYIDSGACFVNYITPIFDIIYKNEIFIVNDKYQTNDKWCHQKSFEILDVNDYLKTGNQIWAGMQGYKSNGKFNFIATLAFEYAKIKECIEGSVKNHRHDQCIYSILTQKNNCPRQDIHTFGEWRGILTKEQVIYVHRGKYLLKPQSKYYRNPITFVLYYTIDLADNLNRQRKLILQSLMSVLRKIKNKIKNA